MALLGHILRNLSWKDPAMNHLIQSPIQSAVSELTTVSELLSLLSMSAGALPLEQSRALIAGLSMAVTLVSEVQNSLDAIEAGSTLRTAA